MVIMAGDGATGHSLAGTQRRGRTPTSAALPESGWPTPAIRLASPSGGSQACPGASRLRQPAWAASLGSPTRHPTNDRHRRCKGQRRARRRAHQKTRLRLPHRDMTARLDSEATDYTTGRDPAETHRAREANPLRQQVRDRELAQRLDRRLPRKELPDVELRSLLTTRAPIRQHLSGRVVIDFLPGWRSVFSQGGDRVAVPIRQARLIRLQALGVMDARAISVISAVPQALGLADPYLDPGGLTLFDPELLIADELG